MQTGNAELFKGDDITDTGRYATPRGQPVIGHFECLYGLSENIGVVVDLHNNSPNVAVEEVFFVFAR